MDGKGRYLDSIFIERLWRTLKYECVYLHAHACANALRELAEGLGLSAKIAVVDGDNVLCLVAAGKETIRDMFTGDTVSHDLNSANAYLGAWLVAQALATGADIVVTGRVDDSALIVGPLIHEFGRKMEDYDRLAGGVLIGHLLECVASPPAAFPPADRLPAVPRFSAGRTPAGRSGLRVR